MSILVLDNTILRSSWGDPQLVNLLSASSRLPISVYRSSAKDWPKRWRDFSHLVMTGSITSADDQSPWVLELDHHIREWIATGRPTLGICYGHQSIVRALHGTEHVQKSPRAEFGWMEVRKTADSPLLKGLPDSFMTFSSHFDEAVPPPTDFERILESDHCSWQGFHWKKGPVFGIQFHPERTPEEAARAYATYRDPELLKVYQNHGRGHMLYKKDVGETLIKNFLQYESR